MPLKTISINRFLQLEVNQCFVCGDSRFHDYYAEGYLYRVCDKCKKLPKVIKFFENKVPFFNE